jgi:asparagine synthase (glutamine-hydrolysing)
MAAGGGSRRGGLCWWVMVPDSQAAASVASDEVLAGARVLARHASGRPWLVGTVRAVEVQEAASPGGRVVAVGEVLADPRQVAAAARRGPTGLLGLPGSFQLGQSVPGGGLRVWTDPVGYRRVFRARLGGVDVMADHAGPLADLLGAELDPVWWSGRLCSPDMPGPLAEAHSPYLGVLPVPAGCMLDTFAEGGAVCCARWWEPPTPDLSLPEGAELLREALATAVAERVRRAGGPVSIQLSGGLDSAALTVLAAAAGPSRLVAATVAALSPANRDTEWARRVADALPVEHRVVGAGALPGFFAGLPGVLPVVDEPINHAAGAARARHVAALLADTGSVVHLNGQGGDEVVSAPPAYLSGLLRRDVRHGWRHLRGQAALRDLSVPRLARAAAHPMTYRRWLGHLDVCRPVAGAVAAVGWETSPVLPRWASARTAATVAAAVRYAAATADTPYDMATHASVTAIRVAARRAALYGRAQRLDGLTPAFPFLDRHVVEAALRVAPWLRADPWQPKPLLTTALAPVAPPGVLDRRDKGNYTAELYAGWRAHRAQITALLTDPMMAELGLVDAGSLNHAVNMFGVDRTPPAMLANTLAVELWLCAYRGAQPSRMDAEMQGGNPR